MKELETKFEMDFYKEFRLPKPTAMIIKKVTSPKGKRSKVLIDGIEKYAYDFAGDKSSIYNDKPLQLSAGLYAVTNITRITHGKRYGEMVWCHYLFIIEPDGTTYPVYESIGIPDTTWVKQALPIVKDYFNDYEIEPVMVKHKIK